MNDPAGVEARVFDGRTSRPSPVRLRVVGGGVDLDYTDGSAPRERFAFDALHWHEPLGATRRLDLPGGRVCEVTQGPALSAFLDACGHRERAITVWQGSGLRVLAAIVLLVLVGFAGYRWGLPLAAKGIAAVLPQSAVAALDEHLLTTLDHTEFLSPTQLDENRRAEIEAAVEPLLAVRDAHDPVELHFRSAPGIGANAFALPGGHVVVTDDLVELAETPQQVAAVVAHELGHVRHRHGLRNLIQASILAAVVTMWTGDASALATGGATVLLNSAYSRDFEREADDYGAELLLRTGQSPMLLAEMLDALTRQDATDGDGGDEEDDAQREVKPESKREGGREGKHETRGHWSDYLSSHPPTPERIERLRRASASARR